MILGETPSYVIILILKTYSNKTIFYIYLNIVLSYLGVRLFVTRSFSPSCRNPPRQIRTVLQSGHDYYPSRKEGFVDELNLTHTTHTIPVSDHTYSLSTALLLPRRS
jgi:hypothetical protein